MMLVLPSVAGNELISKIAFAEAFGVILIPAEPVPNPFTTVAAKVPLLIVLTPLYALLALLTDKVPVPVFVNAPVSVIVPLKVTVPTRLYYELDVPLKLNALPNV